MLAKILENRIYKIIFSKGLYNKINNFFENGKFFNIFP